MAKVRCLATTYMPSKKKDVKFERYEDWHEHEGDVYEVPGNRLQEFLDTGNFERVKGDVVVVETGSES